MDYACSVWRGRHKIAGRTLLPLTLGHCLVLQRVGSPLTPTHRPRRQPSLRDNLDGVLLGDVLFAAFVCSRDWRLALRDLNKRATAFSLRVRAEWRLASAEKDVSDFMAWWRVQWDRPSMIVDQKSAGVRGASVIAILISTERLHYGKSFEAALDTLVGEAYWDHALYHEDEGDCRISAESEDDGADMAAEFERKCSERGVSVPATFDGSQDGVAKIVAELRRGLN